MKDNRQIQIGLWNLPGSGETVEITVRYPLFADSERMYTLHAQPVKIEQREGFSVKSYMPHRGYFTRLESATRYSRKRLEALAEAAETLALARGMFDRIGADTAPAD